MRGRKGITVCMDKYQHREGNLDTVGIRGMGNGKKNFTDSVILKYEELVKLGQKRCKDGLLKE